MSVDSLTRPQKHLCGQGRGHTPKHFQQEGCVCTHSCMLAHKHTPMRTYTDTHTHAHMHPHRHTCKTKFYEGRPSYGMSASHPHPNPHPQRKSFEVAIIRGIPNPWRGEPSRQLSPHKQAFVSVVSVQGGDAAQRISAQTEHHSRAATDMAP